MKKKEKANVTDSVGINVAMQLSGFSGVPLKLLHLPAGFLRLGSQLHFLSARADVCQNSTIRTIFVVFSLSTQYLSNILDYNALERDEQLNKVRVRCVLVQQFEV